MLMAGVLPLQARLKLIKKEELKLFLIRNNMNPAKKLKFFSRLRFQENCLVTLERGSIYDYQYIDVDGRSAEIEIPLKDEHMPNVYVTATLFKKHSKDDTAPFLVGHGFCINESCEE